MKNLEERKPGRRKKRSAHEALSSDTHRDVETFEAPGNPEGASPERRRADQYKDSPMPFLFYWFGIPLILLIIWLVLSSFLDW